ncbi:MAG TPA: TonB-dependent receptor [Verrucomicrobiae bacterium]|nr:TonB-dependent receptor [Verrucomicrobiae bacterium]
MYRKLARGLALLAMLCPLALRASSFGTVRTVVHDPQHRPVAGATVILKSATSDWSQTGQTNQDGEIAFMTVPVGVYQVKVTQSGFAGTDQTVTVVSGSSPVVHFQLKIAPVSQTVTVSSEEEAINPDTATPTTLVAREDIALTPGADRTNSLGIITDFVPGAYVTHDQLHVRGGHQTSWLLDGVEIPNTNIASNLGPQFDPKDIDYLEVQRGSYAADEGDRTYGVFNVVPRTGFERNNQAEFVVSAGNFYQTNDQFNFGSHTERFAYYASVNGNRSNLGIQTPVGQVIHDAENGYGGFTSLIYNPDSQNQVRFVASARRDYYQIPNSPGDQAADGQHETDVFATLSWLHTFNAKTVLMVSPFYHYNSANLDGAANDLPTSTTDHRASRFAGGQGTLSLTLPRNDAQVGYYGFQQRDNHVLGILFHDPNVQDIHDREPATGSVQAVFIQDKFKVAPWLTVIAGVRQTHFSGGVVENVTSPRIGIAVQVPRLNWVFRGFYGDFYQPPPLITASGPLLAFVNDNNLGFIPLRGERDEEHQFGVTVPFHGWSLDADQFRTHVKNFFDHNPIGNSNAFFPLTIDGALIRGWELTLRSPQLGRFGRAHLAYSNQVALGRGAISGGLTDFHPPAGFFTLDHDQRNTLNAGFNANLPWRIFASTNVYYGSGFSNGSPPPSHLPGHTTFDVSAGKAFGEDVSISVTALNAANRHLLMDNSLTFGGFHYNSPREIYGEFRYRFHYGSKTRK